MGSDDIPAGDDAEIRLMQRRRAEQAPLDEAGEGESEGFELAEQELVDHASHGDQHGTAPIIADARTGEDLPEPPDGALYGEADEEQKPDEGQDGGEQV
jgi:hypothetical protein